MSTTHHYIGTAIASLFLVLGCRHLEPAASLNQANGVSIRRVSTVDAPVTGNAEKWIDFVWGKQLPGIVDVNDEAYAPVFYPCSFQTAPMEYCMFLTKNGQRFSDVLHMAKDFLPNDLAGKYGYQPPMVLHHQGEIFVAYSLQAETSHSWLSPTKQVSVINLVSIGTGDTTGSWRHRARFVTKPDETLNYLGGAIGRDGTIYIAGAQGSHGDPALQLLSIPPPYATFSSDTVAVYSNRLNQALYTQVVVNGENDIVLATTLGFVPPAGTVCADGKPPEYLNYKNFIVYKGRPGATFQALESDGTPDFIANGVGDPCTGRGNFRLPLASWYDKPSDKTFVLYDSRTRQPDGSLKMEFILRDVNDHGFRVDLGQKIHYPAGFMKGSIDVTRLGDQYVILALGLSPQDTHILAVTTRDFSTFSAPTVAKIDDVFGRIMGVKTVSPGKNGSDTSRALFYFERPDPARDTRTFEMHDITPAL